jgi:hypothetical protein
MVNNSTNIDKMNKHLSSQFIKHKKKDHSIFIGIGNSCPVLGQAQKWGGGRGGVNPMSQKKFYFSFYIF